MKKIVIVAFVLSFIINSYGLVVAQSADIEGKNWDIRFSSKSFYDDNVIQAPKSSANKPTGLGGESSYAFDFSGLGKYKFRISKPLTITTSYRLNHTGYTDLSKYNQLTHTFGTDAAYFIPNTGKKIWRLNLRYYYMYNFIANDAYNSVNSLSPSIMFMLDPKFGFTRINYTFTNQNNRQNLLRDTDSHSIGINHYYYIFGNLKRRLRVGYAYGNDEAKRGLNDLDSHTLKVRLKTPLIWGINLNTGYRYESKDFDTRAVRIGTGKRDDDRHRFNVEFSKVLIKDYGFFENLTGSLKYERINNDSNDKLFEHNKNVVSLFLEVKF